MKKSIVELAVEHHLGFIAESNGSLFVNEGYKEKELQAFAAALLKQECEGQDASKKGVFVCGH